MEFFRVFVAELARQNAINVISRWHGARVRDLRAIRGTAM